MNALEKFNEFCRKTQVTQESYPQFMELYFNVIAEAGTKVMNYNGTTFEIHVEVLETKE